MDKQQQREAIDLIYARLPTLQCKGKCQRYCGVIAMSKPEWVRITERLGFTPIQGCSMVCPMLCKTSGKCTVYDIRPIICRIWGMVKEMTCPHGCVPSRWMSTKEVRSIFGKIQSIEQKGEADG